MSGRCVEDIMHGFSFHRCANKATSADGLFCGIHDPQKRKERAAKRGPSAFEREMQRRKEREDAIRAEGYRAGLEAAAVECESQSAPVPKMSGATEYGNPAALRCARAIRALAKEGV